MTVLACDVAESTSMSVSSSPLGYVALLQAGDEVLACAFGHTSEIAAIHALKRSWPNRTIAALQSDAIPSYSGDKLIDRLVQYAAGADVEFSDVRVYTADRTTFQRRVIHACQAIPRGETRTYGELATAAGSPRAARAVGTVMASNRVPLIVPCHRVIQASGRLGGYSSPQGLAMKRRLLKLENANVSGQ